MVHLDLRLWRATYRAHSNSAQMVAARNKYDTLYFYDNELSKNQHFLILHSSLAGCSQEAKLNFFFWNLLSPFCENLIFTLTDLNPGFCWPWGMLVIFFVNVIFKVLQMKSFGQNRFEFCPPIQKCHFLTKRLLLKHFEDDICKKYF